MSIIIIHSSNLHILILLIKHDNVRLSSFGRSVLKKILEHFSFDCLFITICCCSAETIRDKNKSGICISSHSYSVVYVLTKMRIIDNSNLIL